MDTIQIVLGILLLVTAVFLIVAVLMQNGKSHGLSGAIAGGAETFFGKQKGSTIEKRLSKLTTIVSIVFVIIVLAIYVRQDQIDLNAAGESTTTATTTAASTDDEDTSSAETDADSDETDEEPVESGDESSAA